MTLLTGQIIHDGIALTGTLELSNAESITKIEVLNGYFEEINLPEGKYQALLISEKPDGTVPELTIEVADVERVTWAELLEKPKAKTVEAIASKPLETKLIDKSQVERLRRIPPPELNPREGGVEDPDYWDREEFVLPGSAEESEDVVVEETEEPEEEVEEEPVTPKIDRQTRNLLEMNARLRT
jgi:hypothetical protein